MTPFQWIEARTAGQAAAEAARPGALLKAGGVDVLDRLKEGLEQPERLVNLRRSTDPLLREIKEQPAAAARPAHLRVGALVTLAQLAADPVVRKACPALAAAAAGAATPQVRALATLGGNLLQRPRCWYFRSLSHECRKKGGGVCFAQDGESDFHAIFDNRVCAIVHPSAAATALCAREAVALVLTPGGEERRVPLAALFQSPEQASGDVRREHTLAVGEVLRAVEIPALGPGESESYLKVKQKQSFDWPLCDVAIAVRTGAGRPVEAARIVLGSVAPVPWRAKAAEAALQQLTKIDPAGVRAVGQAAVQGATPLGKNSYKVALCQGLVARAAFELLGGK